MHRLISRFALAWVLLANTSLALKDAFQPLPVGSLVMARHPGVHFRIKNRNVEAMHCGVIERVQKVQGEWLWLGRGWVQYKDVIPLWEAVEYFTSQINLRPTAFVHTARAMAAGRRGAFAMETESDINKALQLDGSFAPAHWKRGSELYYRGRFQDAIDAYDDAIRLDPTIADVYNDRGAAWSHKGRDDRALKDYDQAIRLCPRMAEAHANRSLLLLAERAYDGAFAAAREALKHDSAKPRAYVSIARYWLAKGDDDRALDAYSKAIELDRQNGWARLERGKIYARFGDNQKAIVDLNQAVQQLPRNAEALEARGYVYYRLGAIEKSRADRLSAKQLQPSPTDDGKKKDASGKENQDDMRASVLPATETSWNSLPVPLVGDFQDNLPDAGREQPRVPAVADFQDNLTIYTGPSDAKSLDQAARRCATSSDERYLNAERAVEAGTQACELTEWKVADFVDTLAAAYAEAGDFEAAVKWQAKAIELGNAGPTLQREAEKRLELYRAHKPCREDVPGRLASELDADAHLR